MDVKRDIPRLELMVSRSFRDIDELNDVVAGWQVDFRQLDRGPLGCDVVQVGGEKILLTHATFDRHIDQRGAAPPDAITLAIPRADAPRIVWRSQVVKPGSLIVYRPGSEIDGASRPGFDVLTISVATPLFADACRRMGRSDVFDLALNLELIRPEPSTLFRFAEALRAATTAPSGHPDGGSPSPAFELETDDLMHLAIETLASARPAPAHRVGLQRQRVIRQVLEYLREREHEAPTVSSLVTATGVSERTLQYAFRERFDVTPKQYIQAHRLQGVRRRLLGSDPRHAGVSDIANEFGFWHMGQFAADYRRHFGELPSETLQKARSGRSSRSNA